MLFWLVAIVTVYILAVKTVLEQVESYEKSPVLVSIDTEPTYVHSIPFPAVSICPLDDKKIHIEVNMSDPMSLEEMDLSETICDIRNGRLKYVSDQTAKKIFNKIYSYEDCWNLIPNILWQNQIIIDPCKHFQPITSKLGFCYTFNSMPLEKIFRNTTVYQRISEHIGEMDKTSWTIDEGYPNDYPSDRVPWRTAAGGFENGLGIFIKAPEHNSTCMMDHTDSIVVFHSPNELPSYHFMVPVRANDYTFAQIVPRVVNTSEKLSQWTPNQRGCYFEEERYLLFFNRYTQKNCDIECEANRTLEMCKCAAFYHPRIHGTPVCGSKNLDCVTRSGIRDVISSPKAVKSCDCKPSCNELEFEIHSSSYKRNWAKYLDSIKRPGHPDTFNVTGTLGAIHASMVTKYTVAVRRDNLLSGIHFIGNIGGLLGLFLGFSILSLIEIVYFVLFRPCYQMYQNFEKKKQVSSLPIPID